MKLHPPGDYLSDLLRRGEEWEPQIIEAVVRRFYDAHGGTIVDVGAMIGTHTVAWARRLPWMRVAAIEPDPENAARLRENTSRLTNVTVWQIALSDHMGWGSLTIDPSNHGHAVLGPGSDIAVATLDSLDLSDVRVIKIDVEGHEREVLDGAWHTIQRYRPILIIEDWSGKLRPLGYRKSEDWGEQHQTYLWEPL